MFLIIFGLHTVLNLGIILYYIHIKKRLYSQLKYCKESVECAFNCLDSDLWEVGKAEETQIFRRNLMLCRI